VLLFLKLLAARLEGGVGYTSGLMLAPICRIHGDVLLMQWSLPHPSSLPFSAEATSWCLQAVPEGGKLLLLVGVHGGRRPVWDIDGASQISSLVSRGHLPRWIYGVAMLLPAGHAGEWSKRSCALSSSSRGWRGRFVLHLGVVL
jgi:hypothetical protein